MQTRNCLVIGMSAAVLGIAATDVVAEEAGVFIPTPHYVQQTGVEISTNYVTQERELVPTEWVWRPMCGSDMSQVTAADLRRHAQLRMQTLDSTEGKVVIDTTSRGAPTNFNLIVIADGSVPQAALDAIAIAEQYIESQFGDNITVRVNVDFANLGSGVIGQAGSGRSQVSYATARSGLVNGMDGDDTIQSALPTGSTIGVRYNSLSTTVTNETRVFFNRANFRATIGTLSSSADADLTFNSSFNFDYDPSNGVSGTDFQSVFIHEVGHALGFTSGADFRFNDIEALDLYRFPRNDSVENVNNDYDPDTIAEFTARPRFADLDTSSSQDNQEAPANSDLISVEYPMSDGRPNQASHFDEGFNGIMDPTLGGGQTFFPNFYRDSDLTMFDALGYDVPPAPPAEFAPVSPADGTTDFSLKGVIEWEEAVGAVSYTLLIDDNADFSSPEVSQFTALTSFTLTPELLDPATFYYWTVTAQNQLGTTEMSPSPFTFTTGVIPPESFGLLTPVNFATDVPVTPTLDWEDSTNAAEYNVQVATNTLFLNNTVDVTIPASSSEYTVPAGELSTQTQYFWRVTAINAADQVVSTPTLQRFTTTAQVNVCTADLDGVNGVDLDDFSIFIAQFGNGPADCMMGCTADLDGVNGVDLDDFSIFIAQFGNTEADCLQ